MNKLNLHNTIFKAAILSGCFFVCSCENSMQEVRDLGKRKTAKDVATNVESYMSQAAVVKAKLTSPLMTRSETDTPIVEFPKTLRVTFYNDSTKPESFLFAKYGRYLERQGKVLLKDSVVVFNIKGDTLLTDELWWDRNQEKFYTDKHVLIKQPDDQQFVGDNGMEADQSFKTWTLFNGSGVRVVADSTLP
ncbi:MAG TPA: LPS export ABC transporter periplasmic protein LptC [Panacibacter sp.]|nr:LPS export ABC transporter periplasmic protein LptC [Panacibacter sp.]HNP44544.1 LPS export ABC transporter periplasmic protein LptC [Panacibacter sp.]